jgi:hypothetical protein
MFLPMNLAAVAHRGQGGSGRGLSNRIWHQNANAIYSPDGASYGYMVGDDFLNFRLTEAVAANVGTYVSMGGGYLSYEDTGGSIVNDATAVGGVIKVATDNTDNDEMWLSPGSTTSVIGKISDTAGDDKLLLFEARFKVDNVTSSNYFIGLGQEGLAAADTITDAGALADKDFIGFAALEGAATSLKFVYQKEGGAMQTVGTYGTALTTGTWVKVGLVYDPKRKASERIAWYVNGEEQSSYVTATNIAASTFPDAEELNPLFGLKNGTGAARILSLDWYAIAQGA